MGNVIPWSQIHPSITSQEPFVAVVIIDPQREICVSEMVQFEPEALASADVAAPELIAAAQAAAARVASGYRARRKQAPTLTLPRERGRENSSVPTLALPGEGTPSLTLPRKRGREKPSSSGGLRVLNGGKR
jgi:hypothetical protein